MRGISLLEMLLVLLILSILLSLSAIGLHHLLQSNQQEVVLKRLTSAIRYARNIAITQQQAVLLCGSEGEQCDGKWSKGWLIMLENSHQIVRQFKNINSLHVVWRGSLGKSDALLFLATGFSTTHGSFYIFTGSSNNQSWRLIVSRGGQMRLLNKA